MLISQLFIIFSVCSCLGWLYECSYCSIVEKRWCNRGFLFGPVCPIYGLGVVGCITIFEYLGKGAAATPWWQIFIICMIGSAVLEYSTSFALEKIFHALWWDYSNMPLNINGRIALPATLGFGVGGILVTKLILPFIVSLHMERYPELNEVVALILMLIYGVDIALTVVSLTSFLAKFESVMASFDERMEAGVATVQEGPAAIGALAKQSAANARDTVSTKVRQCAESLNIHERYHLYSIVGYMGKGRDNVADSLRGVIRQARKTASETGDRLRGITERQVQTKHDDKKQA